MRILFLGDIVSSPGRKAVTTFVPHLRDRENLDFVVANGENASHGRGIEERTATELFDAGVDVITGGNHSFDKRDVIPYMEREPRLLRPANYPEGGDGTAPGKGHVIMERNGVRLGVLNLLGRVHMEPSLECPFRCADKWVNWFYKQGVQNILVDMHAEATSEKQAMGHYLAGRVSAVLGSHSHVPTADERIFVTERGSTAYITDAGMTGPYDSVIGMQKEKSIARFLTKMPTRLEPAEGHAGLYGVIVELDPKTGSASGIRRISMFLD